MSFFSIFIITQGITVVFDYLNITKFVCSIFDFIGKAVPLDLVNKGLVYLKQPVITVDMISHWMFTTVLSCIVAGLTLPIRSICWSLWYKNLSDMKDSGNYRTPKKSKRANRKENFDNER